MADSCPLRVNVLLQELTVEQAANERGACLEAMSALMERHVLRAKAFCKVGLTALF